MLWLALQRGMAATVAVVFLVNAALLWAPVTKAGTQCPTAPLQVITVTEIQKDCCGHSILVAVTRKPKLGEAGFRQCRCAEKQAAQTVEDRSPTKSFLFVLPSACEELCLPSMGQVRAISALEHGQICLDRDPPVPPPPNA